MKYEWFFTNKDFKRSQNSKTEDDIFGNICCESENQKYLIDIHKEYYNSREHGYDLEVYTETDTGNHGMWLGSIHTIHSAKTLTSFKNRAEKILDKFFNTAKNMEPAKECIRI